MGLDIAAYENLELLEILSPDEREEKYHWAMTVWSMPIQKP